MNTLLGENEMIVKQPAGLFITKLYDKLSDFCDRQITPRSKVKN